MSSLSFFPDTDANQAAAHLEAGRHLLAAHASAKAIERFRAALGLQPDNATIHAWLAVALSDSGQHVEAGREADIALSLSPDDAFFAWVKGVTLAASDKWKAAQPHLEHAIALAPSVAVYHAYLAQALFHQGKYAACESSARRALELSPNHELALLYLGFSLLDSQRIDQARAPIERALELHPESADAHSALGLYFLRAGNAEYSVHHIREALRLNPQNKSAQKNLVLAYSARSRFYGLFWKWNLFLWRFGRRARSVIIVGIVASLEILRAISESRPALQIVFVPVLVLFYAFCIYCWAARTLVPAWMKRQQRI